MVDSRRFFGDLSSARLGRCVTMRASSGWWWWGGGDHGGGARVIYRLGHAGVTSGTVATRKKHCTLLQVGRISCATTTVSVRDRLCHYCASEK